MPGPYSKEKAKNGLSRNHDTEYAISCAAPRAASPRAMKIKWDVELLTVTEMELWQREGGRMLVLVR